MKGIKLINSVIFKFTKLINQLERGIALIEQEQDDNEQYILNLDSTIVALRRENTQLEFPKITAKNVIVNLQKLLGKADD